MPHFKLLLCLIWIVALGFGLGSPAPIDGLPAASSVSRRGDNKGYLRLNPGHPRKLHVHPASAWEKFLPDGDRMHSGHTYFFFVKLGYQMTQKEKEEEEKKPPPANVQQAMDYFQAHHVYLVIVDVEKEHFWHTKHFPRIAKAHYWDKYISILAAGLDLESIQASVHRHERWNYDPRAEIEKTVITYEYKGEMKTRHSLKHLLSKSTDLFEGTAHLQPITAKMNDPTFFAQRLVDIALHHK